MSFLRPDTVDAAAAALQRGPAQLLAGGTDYFPSLGEGTSSGTIIDLSAIAELKRVEVGGSEVRIGAGVTWSDLRNISLPAAFDGLKQAAAEIGSVQIQNVATIVGNVCNASPAADGVPPLLTLDADVELTSVIGRRRIPLEEFIVGNRRTVLRQGEFVTAIIVPNISDCASAVFMKLGARRYLVISIVMIAAVLVTGSNQRIIDARVAVGSCSAVARRLRTLERYLTGRHASETGIDSLHTDYLAELAPIDDIRATAAYRADASMTLVRRAIAECIMNSSRGIAQ